MSLKDLRKIPLITQTRSTLVSIGAGAVIIKDGQVLLVKSKDDPRWKFPGGHLHNDESISQAIMRETLEETGLEVKLFGQPFVYEYDLNDELHLILFYYQAEVVGNGAPENNDEIVEIGWFNTTNLPDNCFGNVKGVIDYLD